MAYLICTKTAKTTKLDPKLRAKAEI